MKHFPLKLSALAVAGLIAMGAGAQAGGLYDDDDNGYYNRKSVSSYCYKNPDDVACNPNGNGYYRKKSYHKSYEGGGRCAALIRAAGKRNLVRAFARNSARFAWRREVQAVHGGQYANWHSARNAHISCTRYGAMQACVATATPCR